MTSDLFLPEIAPRRRAACRVPTKAKSHPASCKATCRPSQVIEVGSATAMTCGWAANRSLRRVNPAIVGEAWNRDSWTCPSRVVSRIVTW